jgi:hypothetical protein
MSSVTQDRINRFESNYISYINKQNKVNENVIDISNNISKINKLYMDMSGNEIIAGKMNPDHKKYDFTSETEVYTLNEDRTFIPALLKDKQILLIEHNNLYIVSTLTIATLLMTAIFMSS